MTTAPEPPVPVAAALPLGSGATGPAVAELQRRLRAAGYPTGDDPSAQLLDGTVAALRRFQADHGIPGTGSCDHGTWAQVVEAEFRLGERLLCLVSPMMRGKDVAELQLRLGSMGFDAGRVDGIFGPSTQLAVRDFQRNAGLVCDDVCGPETVEALQRLESRAGRSTVAGVRERERLRQLRDGLTQPRLAVGGTEDGRRLAVDLVEAGDAAGAATLLLEGHWEDQADAANRFAADVVVGISVVSEAVARAAFFEVPGFASYGGQHLARQLAAHLPVGTAWAEAEVHGMRLPLLRETRAAAVHLELGPASEVETRHAELVAGIGRAVEAWIRELD